MTRNRSLTGLAALLPLTLALACVGEDPTGLEDLPDGLVATWFGTSLMVDGEELTRLGTRVEVTFGSDGTYLFEVTKDVTGFFCEADELACEVDGTFTASPTEVVFDPDNDPATLSVVLTETTLNLTGTPDGSSVDLSFVLPPFPDLIGSWLATSLMDETGPVTEGGAATTLAFTFEADGSFRFASTFSPPDVICDAALSCVGEGTYVADAEAGEIVFNPGSEQDVLQLSVDASQLMLLGPLDGVLHDWAFTKVSVPSPGEQGSWWAVALSVGSSDLTETGGIHRLRLDGASYSSDLLIDTAVPSLCVPGSDPPECSSWGLYTVTSSELEFTDYLGGVPLQVSFDAEGVSMRLFGVLDGVAVDFVYARVPDSF